MFYRTAALATAAILVASCGSQSRARDSEGEPVVLPGKVGGKTGPKVIVAVDNHFHDIHPADDIQVGAERGLVVKNEGRNLHSFTLPEADISKELPAGDVIRWRRVGDVLRPGTYHVVCRYHDYVGMTGRFTVVD